MIEVQLQRQLPGFTLDASFTGSADGITAIFGRSGAGKSSIVNAIAGLFPLDQGYIRIGDRPIYDSGANINLPVHQRRVGYVFQDGRLFPHLNVQRNLLYGANFGPADGRIIEMEEVVRLLEIGHLLDRRPNSLSGGEKQRVAIGRALLSRPELLLMDEPLSSLDAALRAAILLSIERVRDELGIPIFYVSHALDEVIRIADHMVVVENGTVAGEGAVADLMSRLDISPLSTLPDAGAVIDATYQNYDSDFDLGELKFAGGTIWIAGLHSTPGTALRAHIRARDVSLMLDKPRETSVLNVFAGTIAEIRDTDGPQLDLLLDVGGPLIARITRKSVRELGLTPGKQVYALVKAVAIDRRSLSGSQ